MINVNETICPKCRGNLKYYDTVYRTIRTKKRAAKYVKLRRFICLNCRSTHREIPNYILPYKHYERELIQGVAENIITCETLGYEDYPCEMTMKRWKVLYSTDFVFTNDEI